MMTDDQLLAEYRTSRSQPAFTEIVNRHAAMVLRTCVRLVGNVHEAEDVLQAVFLVLAQRPDSVRGTLGGWLHEVARRTGCKVVRARVRRTRHESAAAQRRAELQPPVAVLDRGRDLAGELDDALARLPTRLREAVILRYLEGREQEDAARQAGCPRTTLVARSTEGLNRLRTMLMRQGTVLTVPVLAALLAKEAAASAVPVATLTAVSSSLAAGVGATVTPTALLAKSAANGIVWAKAKLTAVVVAAAVTVGAAPVVIPALIKPAVDWRSFTTPQTLATGHTAEVGTIAFSPDGKLLATGSYDGTAKIWDPASRTERWHLKPGTGKIDRVAFSPDGKLIALSTRAQTFKLFDTATGTERRTMQAAYAEGAFVAFSPDGKLLASSTGNDVKLWDLAAGAELATLRGHTDRVNPGSLFSPDGTLLATGSYDRTVRLWDVARRQTRLVLRGHADCVPCVSFTPDGKRLASASWDQTVKIWDVSTGTELLTLRGHTDMVASVAFAPDGKFLASGGWDRTVRLWDPATGQELRVLSDHSGAVWRVAFSPDGRTLASASADQTVKLWGPGAR